MAQSTKTDDDFDLVHYWNVLKRQRYFIINCFIVLMVFALVVLLIWPKSYVSESVVQLGSIGPDPTTALIFDPVSAKALIESNNILFDGVNLYNSELGKEKSMQEFKEDNLEVGLIKEQIGRDQEVASYVEIIVSTSDANLSLQINKIIIANFLNYTVPFYNRTLVVYNDDKQEVQESISDLKKQIESTQMLVDRTSPQGSSASDLLLLTSTLADYRSELLSLQDKSSKIDLALAGRRTFKVVSEPEYPNKFEKPSLMIFLVASVLLSSIIALALGFIREELNRAGKNF